MELELSEVIFVVGRPSVNYCKCVVIIECMCNFF